MRNIEYCYFHRRWRMTSVDLSHSAHHVTTEFVLPVLEDADSIQITLGLIMRMIVCRQVDTKSAGLLLYALQIASANLRRTQFEPSQECHCRPVPRPRTHHGRRSLVPRRLRQCGECGAGALARQALARERILCSGNAS